ncbi:MAG: DUF2306 domain-containing protein [Limnohabitans sp.]
MTHPAQSWTAVIIAHATLAAIAVLLGSVLLVMRKGHNMHRLMGWTWVLCMAAVAGISFAIRRPDGYSWIHGLSVFTLASLCIGVMHARRHRVKAHRTHMVALYIGALLITGLFTLLPGRLIGSALWGRLSLHLEKTHCPHGQASPQSIDRTQPTMSCADRNAPA